jgi:AbrB family looped-hinge helix DNA binding protein
MKSTKLADPRIIRATVTGKNQITIPAAIARALRIEPGMQLEFELGEEHAVLVRPVLSRVERVKQLEEKWQPLFPPGSDPIGDLIRERESIDEEID